MVHSAPPPSTRALDKEIFALAVPAFAALVSEPLLLLADAAIIGHLGTSQLAGLGIAANVLGVLAGLCIFLAYGTTGTVARRLGAGDRPGALAGGIDGMVLAAGLGIVLCAALQFVLPSVIGWYGVEPDVAGAATRYLRIAACGLPSILLLLASTGVLRGLQDTRTPLYVMIITNLVNIILNLGLVYGLGLGIAGSALGTLLAQTGAAVFLAAIVVRGARREHIEIRLRPGGVMAAIRSGVWLVARTATLHAAITLTTLVAATGGAVALAAHQVVYSIWVLLVFALDAIAIAGQAIIGRQLGAGDITTARSMTRRMIGWGVLCGVLFGAAVLLTGPLFVGMFSPDRDVQQMVVRVLLAVAVITPVAGVVFVLDGVLIGAGDGRYLALAGLLALLAYVPLALTVNAQHGGLLWLWLAYGGYITARMLTLTLRIRGDRWLRVGASI